MVEFESGFAEKFSQSFSLEEIGVRILSKLQFETSSIRKVASD